MEGRLRLLTIPLSKYSKGFPIHGKNVHILNSPSEFYSMLLEKTESASKIILTSLYLGTGSYEQALVDKMYQRVQECRQQGHQAKVKILLDANRGLRGDVNSCTMLTNMVRDFTADVQVSLFHTPSLRPWMKWLMRGRLNETVGLQHMKIYLFDDSVIISGANLSEDYFVNRQDRYILLEKCPALCLHLETLVSTVSKFSFRLNPDGTLSTHPECEYHPTEDSESEFCRSARRLVLSNGVCPPASVTPSPAGLFRSISSLWRDRTEDTTSHDGSDESSSSDWETDTVVFPLVEMGPLGVHSDSLATAALLADTGADSQVALATGYFNLTDAYRDVIVSRSSARYDILVAAPKSNGFFGAKGIAGIIPATYVYLAQNCHRHLIQSGIANRIRMFEYYQPGWTFHAKGLWYTHNGSEAPSLTLIGSPNFGYRSMNRDLELQVAVVTRNETLRKKLHEEKESLFHPTSLVTEQTFKREDCRVPFWVRVLMPFLKMFF